MSVLQMVTMGDDQLQPFFMKKTNIYIERFVIHCHSSSLSKGFVTVADIRVLN